MSAIMSSLQSFSTHSPSQAKISPTSCKQLGGLEDKAWSASIRANLQIVDGSALGDDLQRAALGDYPSPHAAGVLIMGARNIRKDGRTFRLAVGQSFLEIVD